MTPHLLLASASPRRRRLLALLGVEYDVGSVDVPEDIPAGDIDAVSFATGLAADKARAARDLAEDDGCTVVAADTIVVHSGRVLGKPADIDDAVSMLASLSGRMHAVVTAVAVLPPGADEPVCEAVTSEVAMRALDRATIDAWVAGGQVLGCAGAYNIESHLASVEPTECFQNVAGLPLCHLYLLLQDVAWDLPGLSAPREACDRARGVHCELGRRLLPDA